MALAISEIRRNCTFDTCRVHFRDLGKRTIPRYNGSRCFPIFSLTAVRDSVANRKSSRHSRAERHCLAIFEYLKTFHSATCFDFFDFDRTPAHAVPLHHVNFKCKVLRQSVATVYSLKFPPTSRSSYSPRKRSIASFSLSFGISHCLLERLRQLPQRTSNTLNTSLSMCVERDSGNPKQNFQVGTCRIATITKLASSNDGKNC